MAQLFSTRVPARLSAIVDALQAEDGGSFVSNAEPQSFDIVTSKEVADIQDIKGKIIGISAPIRFPWARR